MKYKDLFNIIIIVVATSFTAFSQEKLYQSRDFTAEQLFSRNIEGPVVDGRGRLFVVNVERDGTIGLVGEKGECQVFVRLPEGSVGNSLRFGKRGELYVADFKAHNVLRVDTATKHVSIYAHSEEFNQPNDRLLSFGKSIYAASFANDKLDGKIPES
jgi:streptogramin lyase